MVLFIRSTVSGTTANNLKQYYLRCVIVPFNSIKHRTSFCQNKNKSKGGRIQLSLKEINCRFKVASKDGTSKFLKDISKVNDLIKKQVV